MTWKFAQRWLLLVLAVLAGCAVSPESTDGKALHEALWQRQQQNIAQTQQTAPAAGRLWVLAAGLSDETKAFPGDVLGTVEGVKSLRPDALVWSLWNAPFCEQPAAPFATRESLRRAVAVMRDVARPGDRILVMLTSHGYHDLLSPLSDWETGVVISACYSGSLTSALRHPKRWIMTAAAADRNSYGCQFHGKQTYFIQGLLSTFAGPSMGLDAWHAATSQRIRAGEDAAKLTPSLPQLWVGPAVQHYRQSLASFWRPQP